MIKPIINIKIGSKPVDAGTIERAKKAYMEARGWTDIMRDDAMVEPTLRSLGWIEETPAFMRAMQDLARFENALALTIKINTYNADLDAYNKAVNRLNQVNLATGLPAIFEDLPTDKVDADGILIMENIMVQSEILPLPAEIEVNIIDNDGTVTGTEMVPNPLLEKDAIERKAAQIVVDAGPPSLPDGY